MNRFSPLVRFLTVISVIVFIFMGSIRFLISPVFLAVEYRMPGFPPDTYGFSFEERMTWARVSVHYLNSRENIDYLAQQSISDGVPLYNERELSHMEDVKFLIDRAMITWYISIALLILLGLFSHEYGLNLEFWDSVSKGGLWIIGIIVAILLGVVMNFDYLFTQFHHLFFQGDTWLFSYSDSLIRLFPIRFWQDAFIMMGGLAVIGGLLAFFLGRRLRRKNA